MSTQIGNAGVAAAGGTTVGALFHSIAQSSMSAVALIDGERTGTYAQVDERTTCFANRLADLGLKPGSRLAVLATNCIEYVEIELAAAKAGVIGFTKALAKELARSTVTVNAVAPGMIQTPFLDAMPPEALEKAVAEILIGRIGTPEDIAEAVTFLCSDKARFITGEILRVDGGQYI